MWRSEHVEHVRCCCLLCFDSGLTMIFQVYTKQNTYTMCVSGSVVIRDALAQLCGTLRYKTVRNKFGSQLDLNLKLNVCIDNRDALWVFDDNELFQFNFVIGQFSFVVVLAPYKQINDLFTEAQRVFHSLYEMERWKEFRYILQCGKDDNCIWNVKPRFMKNIGLSAIYNIFNNKDTIYCCCQEYDIQFTQITFLLFFPGWKRQEYGQLRSCLRVIEKLIKVDLNNWNSITWKWLPFDSVVDSSGFYLKTKDCSISPPLFEVDVTTEVKQSRNDSGFCSDTDGCDRKQSLSNAVYEDKVPSIYNITTSQSSATTPTTQRLKEPVAVLVLDDSDVAFSDSSSCSERIVEDGHNNSQCNHSFQTRNEVSLIDSDDSSEVHLVSVKKNGKFIEDNDKECIKEILNGHSRNNVIRSKFYHRNPTSHTTGRRILETKRKRYDCFLKSFLAKKDIDSLKPGRWLNDEIINCYMKLVMRCSRTKTIYAFNSFFYTSLRSRGYSSVRRWTKKVDLFQNDLVMFPIHSCATHWTLVVANIPEKVITYYNSFGRSPDRNCQTVIREYLKQESVQKGYNYNNWLTTTCKDNPVQQNEDDCGVFVCLYAKCLALDVPMNFTQDHMKMARKLITKEIFAGKLFARIY